MKIASRSYKYARVNKFLGKHIIWSLVKCFLKLLEEFKFVSSFSARSFFKFKIFFLKDFKVFSFKRKEALVFGTPAIDSVRKKIIFSRNLLDEKAKRSTLTKILTIWSIVNLVCLILFFSIISNILKEAHLLFCK